MLPSSQDPSRLQSWTSTEYITSSETFSSYDSNPYLDVLHALCFRCYEVGYETISPLLENIRNSKTFHHYIIGVARVLSCIKPVLFSTWTTIRYIFISLLFTARFLLYLLKSLYQVYLTMKPIIHWYLSTFSLLIRNIIRYYEFYEYHFPEELHKLITGTAMIFLLFVWLRVRRPQSQNRDQMKGTNITINIQNQQVTHSSRSFSFQTSTQIESVSDRPVVWSHFVRAMNFSVIDEEEIPFLIDAFASSKLLKETRENEDFLARLVQNVKSITSYNCLKRMVLTMDINHREKARMTQEAIDQVMSMPIAFSPKGLIEVLRVVRDQYHLAFVPEGGKQLLIALINIGPLRKMTRKERIIKFIKESPEDDPNIIARSLLKTVNFHQHQPITAKTPTITSFLQVVDSVKGVPKTPIVFPDGKKTVAILDCGSLKPFISKNLLPFVTGVISQSVNNPVKRIITTTASKLIPNDVIRLHFQLPAVDSNALYVEEFDIVPTDNLLALGAEFLKRHEIDPMLFVDTVHSKRKMKIDSLIEKYVRPLLFTEPIRLPSHSQYDYHLKLKGSIDQIKPRPLIKPHNLIEEKFMTDELHSLEAKGFIRKVPPTSAYSVPFVVSTGKKPRLVFDFRQLNDITEKIPSELPLINELVSGLHGKVVSILDLTSAYHHIRLSDESSGFTTFKSILGFYAFSVLAFGLSNAPEVFQRFVGDILSDFRAFSRCYLDDVLIISDSIEQHIEHLSKVLQRLKEHELHLNLEKSIFFEEKEFNWLGHRFILNHKSGNVSIHPADKTINIIKSFPTPTSKVELQRYLGHLNYIGTFIPNLAQLCSPFHPLLLKNSKFKWTQECQAAFEQLQELELAAMARQSFIPGRSTTIVVDASDVAVGCAMLQENAEGKLVPVEFRSKTLTGFQKNWSTTEKELYALKLAVDKFQFFISASSEITVETDHKALSDMFASENPTPKQVRWINFIICGHSIRIKHVPGSTNQLADYLSRYRPISPNDSADDIQLDIAEFHHLIQTATELTIDESFSVRLAESYLVDEKYRSIIQAPEEFPDYTLVDGFLYFQEKRLVIPSALIEELLNFYHTSVFGGHAGSNKLYKWLKQHYYFTAMSRVIQTFVGQCVRCQRVKAQTRRIGHLQPSTDPIGRWTNIAIDIVSGFNDVKMDGIVVNAALVLVDIFSHRCHFFPVNKSLNSSEFADIMLKRYLPLHGLPTVIHSDLDTTFTSAFTKQVLDSFKIQHETSVSDHHQSNGIAERKIRSLQEFLRLFIDTDNMDWVQYLSYAELFLNSTPSVPLGDMSPFEVDLGYRPTSVDDFVFPAKVASRSLMHADARDLIEELKIIETTARACINEAHERSAQYYNRSYTDVEFDVGDQVFVRSELLRTSGNARDKELPRSLRNRFAGPYTVTAKLSAVNYEIALPPSSRRSPKFHISQLKRIKKGEKGMPAPPTGAAQVFKIYKDGSEETELKKILGHKRKAKGYLLYVEFVDGVQQWIRMSELKKTAKDLCDDYIKDHPELN